MAPCLCRCVGRAWAAPWQLMNPYPMFVFPAGALPDGVAARAVHVHVDPLHSQPRNMRACREMYRTDMNSICLALLRGSQTSAMVCGKLSMNCISLLCKTCAMIYRGCYLVRHVRSYRPQQSAIKSRTNDSGYIAYAVSPGKTTTVLLRNKL